VKSEGIAQVFLSRRIAHRTILAGVLLLFTTALWVAAQTPADEDGDDEYRGASANNCWWGDCNPFM